MSTPALNPDEIEAWRDAVGDVVHPGQVLADKYRLDGVLGAGGMGVVLKAWHLHFEERVAVKLMLSQAGSSTTARARFEREARAAFKIKSEHAARVIDIGFLPTGQPFIVMEFLEGLDLGHLLEQRGPLPVAEAVDYVLQAAEAVAEAHVRRIVHRDLKPDNLFLTRGPDGGACVKVVDFGISKEGGEPEVGGGPSKASLLTAAGTTLGTPAYMAPEQWGSAQSVGPSADIWAFGIIVHQLLTGQLPFVAVSLRELFGAVMSAPAVPLRHFRPDLPAQVEQVILRCLEKDASARFGSVAELAAALGPFGSAQAQESVARIARVQRSVNTLDPSSADRVPGGEPNLSAARAVTAPTTAGGPAPAAVTGPPFPIPGAGASGLGTPQGWQGPSVIHHSMASPRRGLMLVLLAMTALVLGAGGWLAAHFLGRAAPDAEQEAAASSGAPERSGGASATAQSGAGATSAGSASTTTAPGDASAKPPTSSDAPSSSVAATDVPPRPTAGGRATDQPPATKPAATQPAPKAKATGGSDPFREM